MLDNLKEYIKMFFNSRLLPITVVFVLLFSILVNRMFELQIVDRDSIIASGASNTIKEKDIKATRGNIYDCNGTLLAYNKLSYNIVFSETSKLSGMTNDEKNQMIHRLLYILQKHGSELSVDYYLQYEKGKLLYQVEGSSLERYLADAYSVQGGVKALTQEQKDTTPQEMYDYLIKKFEISSEYDQDTAIDILAVRYAMFINRYAKFQDIILAKNVDENTVAAIKENSELLPGVDIDQNTSRVYKKSKYFAHMLGYTGSISAEKLEELEKDDEESVYSVDDQIGISGLESTYEEYLRGTKGSKEITVDGGTSRIISEKTTKDPVAGNDLYLTIDAKLQEECYHLLEERIAGILISNINNSMDAGTRGNSTKDIRVPIYDVYNAIIKNNIVNVERFNDDDASTLEKATLKKYKNKKKVIVRRIRQLLASGSTANAKSLSSDINDFLDYFYRILTENSVVITKSSESDSSRKSVDTSDATYKGYVNGSVSLSKYLQYAISKQWIDLDKLNIGNDFYSTQEIYKKLVDYGIDLLENDTTFTKMIYSYMIYHYELSGRDICLLLFDQGDIKYNAQEYSQVKNSITSPYSFLIRKIKKLEITPGQLGLDPCSGSIIVTDVNTGDVKAMVTYPSYDNNKMANQVDSDYFYTYLKDSTASPLLNRPTQQEIAPGSTFKMVSSVAALQEGLITPSSTVYDTVTYTKAPAYGSPKCWSSSSHGNLNVAGAIEHSCNVFFYEMGYRLGNGHNGRVNDKGGLARLKKYADMFGLTDKSGVEIMESAPHFSTTDILRSCIGQGSHAYAPIQLARYVTTVANSGTCYDLTLVDKIKDVNGKTVLNNSAKVRNKVQVAQSTWQAVHNGMYRVVNGAEHGSIFAGMKKKFAGKTGTAQQNTLHPNHAYFLSYGPYGNPEISVSCVIPNGYTSSYAMECARDVYQYYFGDKKVSGGKATSVDHYARTND